MELLKIAWRNIWRNKRRTLITIASIFFATFIAILTRSMQLGSYNYILDAIVKNFSGHLQIQQKDYFLNPSIDNLLPYSKELISKLEQFPQIVSYNPRLQTGAFFYVKDNSKVGVIVGIDPQKEQQFSNITEHIAKFNVDTNSVKHLPEDLRRIAIDHLLGFYTSQQQLKREFLAIDKRFKDFLPQIFANSEIHSQYFVSDTEQAVLIGSKLAKLLKLKVGDSLIILTEGYHGATAAGKFVVKGILHFPNPQFNELFVYLPLKTAQQLLSAFDFDDGGKWTGLVSYVSINTVYPASLRPWDYKQLKLLRRELMQQLNNEQVRVLTWKELNRELEQQIQSDNVGGIVMILVLFFIITLGVLGTVIMMTMEREKEFAVEIAIGMRRGKLFKVVVLEVLLIAMVAVGLAILFALPVVIYGDQHPIYLTGQYKEAYEMFNAEPILKFNGIDWYILSQALIVFLLTMFTLIYPALFIFKLNVAKALKD